MLLVEVEVYSLSMSGEEGYMRSRILRVLLLLGLLYSSVSYAKGTLSGTVVSNQALIVYELGGIEHNLTTNTESFVVDQVVDLLLAWQDSAAVETGAGESGWVLTFLLRNEGNGEDNVTLAYEHNSSSDFAVTHAQLFLDSDGDGSFSVTNDQPVTDINLTADSNVTLFLVADIPEDNSTVPGASSYDGIVATSSLLASSTEENASAVDIVVRNGSSRDQGEYLIRDYWLVSEKSATPHSEDNQTHTGTVITYTIDLSIGGNAEGREIGALQLEDMIPEGTRYVPGSLHLDDRLLSDSRDGDSGEANTTAVQVSVGTISGTEHRLVTFDVEVE